MKKQHIYLLFTALVITLVSCSKDDERIEPAKSSAKQITDFVFRAIDNDALTEDVTPIINETNKTISATVVYGTDIKSLTPTLAVSEKAVVDQTGAKDFSSPVDYTITAEDGTKAVYKITVAINPSDSKEILVFGFKANENNNLNEDIIGAIDQDTKTINVILPENSLLNDLIPYIEISTDATISPLGVQDFTNPITYIVTAQDGSTIGYEVIITLTLSSSKQILSFIFKAEDNLSITDDIEGTINEDLKTIEFVYTNGVDLSLLQPTLEVSPKSSIDKDGPQNFTNTILYKVTAEDGSITDYKVIGISNLEKQRQVLIAIYNANPNNTLPWNLEDPDITNWYGVRVDENNNIIELYLLAGRDFDALGYSLTILPAEISSLTFLKILDLGGNDFTEIPSAIFKLKNLERLSIDSNKLTSIPNDINQLEKLMRLNLDINQIKSIPTEIGKLTNLQILRLHNNQVTDLPSSLGQLSNLQSFFVFNNKLTSIPPEIGQLKNLQSLYLSNNQLTSIPQQIGDLISLTDLYLSTNKLNNIPPGIGELTRLRFLRLEDNQLTSIPEEIGNLKSLTIIAFGFKFIDQYTPRSL